LKINLNYLLNNSELDKEEVEKLGFKELRASFNRTIDKANSFGLRKINMGEVNITESTCEIDLSKLTIPFEYNISIIKAVYVNNTSTKLCSCRYKVVYKDKPYLVFDFPLISGNKVYIIYTSSIQKEDEIDVEINDVEILTLIFEGSIYEKLADMYSKTGEKSLEADITNYIEKARFYQDRAISRYNEAKKIIHSRLPTGTSVVMKEVKDWITH